MSLAALALRIVTVKAVSGRTIAEDRVFDSQIETIDSMVLREPAPLVIVSVDDGDSRDEPKLQGDGTITLLIETAVSGPVELTGDLDSAGLPIVPPLPIRETSQGLEAALDILWRQIYRALLTPAAAPWGDLWHQFALDVTRIEKRRGGGAEKGVRFASRFILVSVTPIDDPPFGQPPAGPWANLVTAMQTDPDLAPLATALAHEIEAPAGLVDWRVAQALLGISGAGIRGIGLAPFAAEESDLDSVGEVAAVLVEAGVTANADAEWTTDDEAATDALPPEGP